MEQFLLHLDSHLSSLANLNKPSLILTDSNIHLASLNHIQNSNDYLKNIISNGFIPINSKSSRVQGNTHSFIDHILTNITNSSNLRVGTIISDISNHFFNFVAYKTPSTSRSHNSKTLHDINITNTETFVIYFAIYLGTMYSISTMLILALNTFGKTSKHYLTSASHSKQLDSIGTFTR
jgi:hypothetical protein